MMLSMAHDNTEKQTVTVRWEIPAHVLDGLKAAHLVHGSGQALQEYVSERLYESTPLAFRKQNK